MRFHGALSPISGSGVRWSRYAALALLISVLFGSTLGPVASWMPQGGRVQAATSDSASGFNVDAIGLDRADKETLLQRIGDVRFGWMRRQIRWSAYEPTKGGFQSDYAAQVDALVDMAAAKGVNILFSTVNSPGWAGAGGGLPRDPQDYADFVTFMARRYGTKVQAYEVWNEENYAHETGGKVDVAAYLPVLRAGYRAIKAVNKNLTVVFGGLTPTSITGHPEIAVDDVEFLTQLYALNGGEVTRYYDVLGAHPGATCNPPDTSWPTNPATATCGADADGGRSYTKENSFYFKRILQVRQVMEQHGEGSKPIWLTEFGWSSMAHPPPDAAYAAHVTEQQQAQYLIRAIAIGRSYPWLGVMFVWNLNFQVTSDPGDEKWGYGILRKDWSPRPAYEALRSRTG